MTKFNAQGTGLIYSTYVPTDTKKNTVQAARALAVDAAGNAWIGVAVGSTIAVPSGTPPVVVELNPTGSAVVASAVQAGLGNVVGVAGHGDAIGRADHAGRNDREDRVAAAHEAWTRDRTAGSGDLWRGVEGPTRVPYRRAWTSTSGS